MTQPSFDPAFWLVTHKHPPRTYAVYAASEEDAYITSMLHHCFARPAEPDEKGSAA